MIDGVPLIDAHVHAPALEGLRVPWTDWTGGFPSGESTRALYENSLVVPERFHAYLEQEGVDKFSKSWQELLDTVSEQMDSAKK